MVVSFFVKLAKNKLQNDDKDSRQGAYKVRTQKAPGYFHAVLIRERLSLVSWEKPICDNEEPSEIGLNKCVLIFISVLKIDIVLADYCNGG